MDTGCMMVAADTLGPSGPDPATCNQHEEKKTSPCQTTGPRARSVRVQVSANLKEKGVQAELQPRMRSIGVQFNGRDDIPDSQSAQKPALTHDSSSSDQSMATPCDSEAASMYEPSGSSSDESRLDMEGEVPHNPLEERKFIVSESQLLDLFNCCKMCHRFARADVQQVVGTMVRIVTECMFCGYSWQWCSQPSIGTIPAGNLALSASILFSGALAAKVLRVLQCMGVATISRRTFATHHSSILFPSIARVWNSQQMEYVRRCQQKGQPLVIGGDGRADSPGHSAKYGSYSTIDLEEGIVIDIQYLLCI
ncbi:uncharacterized protein LOC125647123 [Ostrea edulis]|uniref:uncharacterized protein LOC125647123 n=1 Tax=Ostrea edulis TaxID=37623 RepID=UPI0024AF3A28|nr:uncharacterized protein LOC125647123 [Ostrea edulis]